MIRSIAIARKRVPRPASGSSSCTPSGVAIVRDSSYSIADIMMSPELFQAQRANGWAELDDMLRRAGDRPERLGADGVRRLGALYRSAAADLAFARRSYPGHPLVGRLEGLVLRGRAAVYGRVGRRQSVWQFVSRGYWRRLAERPSLVFAAWALLLLPAALGAVWALVDSASAAGLIPGEFQAAADPPTAGRDFDAATSSAFSVSVMTNNIQVTLFAFVGGITYGLVTIWALFFNGLILGVIGGLAVGAGNGVAFLRLISSHRPLEISCILIRGGGGGPARRAGAGARPAPRPPRRARGG